MIDSSQWSLVILAATLGGALLLAAAAKAFNLEWLESLLRAALAAAAAGTLYVLWRRYL